MAVCPRCGSRLEIEGHGWRKFFMTEKFVCPACHWTKPIKDVQRDGGLHTPIKKEYHSNKRRNKKRHSRRRNKKRR